MRPSIAIILLTVKSVFSQGRLQIFDSSDSVLYQAPKNPRRQNDHLSSFILRAESDDREKYFTGSPKPVWDETELHRPMKSYVLECKPGKPCSQTIPWSSSSWINEDDNFIEQNYQKVTFKPTLAPPVPKRTSSYGLSFASLHSSTAPSIKWPKVTEKPTVFHRPTTIFPSPDVQVNRVSNYDPFAFHVTKAKKRLQRPSRIHQFEYQRPEEVLVYEPQPSHYKDSRFEVQSYEQPRVVQQRNHENYYRPSLTWKGKRHPLQQSNYQSSQAPQIVKRMDYAPGLSRYFPQKEDASNYQEYESHYNHVTNIRDRPRRNYFPVEENEPVAPIYASSSYQDENEDYERPFVGEEQVVNAGYTVKESELQPTDYLISSYEQTMTNRERSRSTLKPWTSLDMAKPAWEADKSSASGLQNPGTESTYGTWDKDRLKLNAVPFSRATDGQRRWTKIASVKKRKRIPVKSIVVDENVGLNT